MSWVEWTKRAEQSNRLLDFALESTCLKTVFDVTSRPFTPAIMFCYYSVLYFCKSANIIKACCVIAALLWRCVWRARLLQLCPRPRRVGRRLQLRLLDRQELLGRRMGRGRLHQDVKGQAEPVRYRHHGLLRQGLNYSVLVFLYNTTYLPCFHSLE